MDHAKLIGAVEEPKATRSLNLGTKLGPRLGIISDTHGLLRPEALAALRGSDLIIHAGDVGAPDIIEKLEAIAPVFVVQGNIDNDPWAHQWPETQIVETDHAAIYVLHDVHKLDLNPAAAGFQIVVSGHSHQPSCTYRQGAMFINPGSAGPRRFKLPICLARLDLNAQPWRVEFVDL